MELGCWTTALALWNSGTTSASTWGWVPPLQMKQGWSKHSHHTWYFSCSPPRSSEDPRKLNERFYDYYSWLFHYLGKKNPNPKPDLQLRWLVLWTLPYGWTGFCLTLLYLKRSRFFSSFSLFFLYEGSRNELQCRLHLTTQRTSKKLIASGRSFSSRGKLELQLVNLRIS